MAPLTSISKKTILISSSLLLLVIIVFIIINSSKSEIEIINEYSKIENVSKESCLTCHQNTKGYSGYHNPELIGCASCHLGNINSKDKEKSHKGMILIPGNLSDAKETCGKCHPNELAKIENSLMTTNSGLVAVNKYIFGEADSPNGQYHIQLLAVNDFQKLHRCAVIDERSDDFIRDQLTYSAIIGRATVIGEWDNGYPFGAGFAGCFILLCGIAIAGHIIHGNF